jgi:ArsR family transcriptional regulator
MRMKQHSPDSLDQSVELFKAFADPVRLRLLNLLAGGEVCVCHLHEALELPQSTVSRHLAYLRRRGLVMGRKEGLWVLYRLAKPVGELHRRLLDCLGGCCRADRTGRDRQRLAGRACCGESSSSCLNTSA